MLLLLFIFGAPVFAEIHCEVQTLPRAKAMVRLIQLGLKFQELKSEDLQTLTLQPELQNPYLLHGRKLENFIFRKAFSREYDAATAAEKSEVMSVLTDLVRQQSGQELLVADARKDTEQVFAPKILRQLTKRGFEHIDENLGMTFVDGRPVIFTRGTIVGTDHARVLVFDPFHPQKNKRALAIEDSGGHVSKSDSPMFFEKNSTPYAMYLSGRKIIDVKELANVYASRFGLHSIVELKGTDRFTLAQSENGRQVAIIITHEDKMLEADLKNPGVRPRTIDDWIKKSSYKPRADNLTGKTYVTYHAKNYIHIYDVSEQKMLPSIRARESVRSENHVLAYEDRGRHYLAYTEQRPRDYRWTLKTVDLESRETKTVRKYFELPLHIEKTTVNGIPHLYFFDEKELVLVNLRSKRVETFPMDENVQIASFEWRGRGFLTWANMNGELKIFDLVSRQFLVNSAILPDTAYGILPFSYQGHIFGLVSLSGDWPLLLQLTHGGGDKPRDSQ